MVSQRMVDRRTPVQWLTGRTPDGSELTVAPPMVERRKLTNRLITQLFAPVSLDAGWNDTDEVDGQLELPYTNVRKFGMIFNTVAAATQSITSSRGKE